MASPRLGSGEYAPEAQLDALQSPHDYGIAGSFIMIELRCGGTMHGKLDIQAMRLEVKCGRRSCGAGRGVVVLHTFDLTTGELVGTARFADPVKKEELSHASR